MFNKRRVKRAMEKRRKQKHMPFKSDNYTDFFYCKANFDRLRLSIAEFKASENRTRERIENELLEKLGLTRHGEIKDKIN